jgi:hypothetical protein
MKVQLLYIRCAIAVQLQCDHSACGEEASSKSQALVSVSRLKCDYSAITV